LLEDIDANLRCQIFAACQNEKASQSFQGRNSDDYDEREPEVGLLLERYPLWKYAAERWPTHYQLATDSRAADLVLNVLLGDNKAGFLYMMYYMTQFHSLVALPTFITGLHLSCLFGLHITDRLLDTLKEQDSKRLKWRADSFNRTPLWLALACGHLDTVNRLLENGLHPSGRGDGRGRPREV